MQIWLDQRSATLLAELNALPFTDDHDLKKAALIKRAFRDVAGELVRRSAERAIADMVSEQAMAIDPALTAPAAVSRR
ncbi:hypothetical protein HPT27_07400 [Permianibacter sp. IMCC34836]|uniref:hypothetical protein n=1 Tax=Permianibacter fluminis TaxID=2738515 RepID=UPI001552837E|nr:hypothetical protein [Permianibacter fluminis]NQD36848.1 hypothetical protein [Permianibacter fluminis]